MKALGAVLIGLGVALTVINPRPGKPQIKLTGLRVRGIAGPVLIVLGILILTGVIPV